MCTYITKKIIEIPPCAKKVIFSTEFVLLDLNPHFYEVNQEVWKRPCAWRNFKNIFCVLSTPPKKPFRTEKTSIFNFRYVKEVWVSGLLGVNRLPWDILYHFRNLIHNFILWDLFFSGHASDKTHYKGPYDCLKSIYRQQGIRGWYKGLVPMAWR